MQGFDFKELLLKFRIPLICLLVGLILLGSGLFFIKSGLNFGGTKVEVLSESIDSDNSNNVTAEISGEVITPGVYKVPSGGRIDDLLILAGGLTAKADREWTDKYLNRAAKVSDGQKVYIPSVGQQSKVLSAKNGVGDQTISSTFSPDSNAKININSASLDQLDSLPGIGQVYGQNIIEHRPYSNVSELSSKGVLKTSVYDKIKDLITIY